MVTGNWIGTVAIEIMLDLNILVIGNVMKKYDINYHIFGSKFRPLIAMSPSKETRGNLPLSLAFPKVTINKDNDKKRNII